MKWRKVTLVGVGLLGGSLGQALRQRKLCERVAGYVRREASIEECRRVGAVDEATTDLGEAVSGAELIVLCTPISQMRDLLRKAALFIQPQAVITDVGSVKGRVVSELEEVCAAVEIHFVGSHPMAGAEKMGVLFSRPELFQDAVCVITPSPNTDQGAMRKVDALWRSVGSRVLSMSPEDHDRLVSRSSHLPHVIAAELVHQVLHDGHPPEQAALCATGFRDTTRIASGSPEMWRDIALANRENLGRSVDEFIQHLQQFRQWLDQGNEAAIETFFAEARRRRQAWCDQGKSPE